MFRAPFSRETNPCPSLEPLDVVKIQLDALQNDDLTCNHAGIRAAYRFASPANQMAVGPVEKFIEMHKSPLYSPMIGFTQAHIERVERSGDTARTRAHLLHPEGFVIAYLFALSRQQKPPYDGCWMTDGVLRLS